MKFGDAGTFVVLPRFALGDPAESSAPDAADTDAPYFAPGLAGGSLERQRRLTAQAGDPCHHSLSRVHGHQHRAISSRHVLAQHGLTVEQRDLQCQGALCRRPSHDRRRHAPLQVEFDVALDPNERGESAALPPGRHFAALRRLQTRQLQGSGQQAAILDAGHQPAVTVHLDNAGRSGKGDLQAVHGRRSAAQHDRVPTGRNAQPERPVWRSQDLRCGGAVKCDGLRMPAPFGSGQGYGHVVGRMNGQRHADAVAAGPDLGRRYLRAARHAIGWFEEARFEFAQQFAIGRLCLGVRAHAHRQCDKPGTQQGRRAGGAQARAARQPPALSGYFSCQHRRKQQQHRDLEEPQCRDSPAWKHN